MPPDLGLLPKETYHGPGAAEKRVFLGKKPTRANPSQLESTGDCAETCTLYKCTVVQRGDQSGVFCYCCPVVPLLIKPQGLTANGVSGSLFTRINARLSLPAATTPVND